MREITAVLTVLNCRHEHSDDAIRETVTLVGESNQQSCTPAAELRDVSVPGQSAVKSDVQVPHLRARLQRCVTERYSDIRHFA